MGAGRRSQPQFFPGRSPYASPPPALPGRRPIEDRYSLRPVPAPMGLIEDKRFLFALTFAAAVVAFGIFTLMVLGNIFNWTVGRWVLRSLGILARIPKTLMLPIVLLITLTAVYAQDGGFVAIWVVLIFGALGYLLRRLDISLLPFVSGFILSPKLEELIRGGYSASGNDPLFLVKSPLALVFLAMSVAIGVLMGRRSGKKNT